ncbi:MAG: hypothetical protein KIG95_11070 [Comamonas sp.]|nr:hypothetical protein [Comamonas sp.]
MRLRHQIILSAIWGLGVAVPAHALSLGAVQGQAFLGTPLDVLIGFVPDPGQTLESSCVEASARFGESAVPVQVSALEPYGIRIHSQQNINEPVVSLYVQAGCTSKMARRYTLLADPAPVQTAAQTPALAGLAPVPALPTPTPPQATAAAPAPAASAQEPTAPSPTLAAPVAQEAATGNGEESSPPAEAKASASAHTTDTETRDEGNHPSPTAQPSTGTDITGTAGTAGASTSPAETTDSNESTDTVDTGEAAQESSDAAEIASPLSSTSSTSSTSATDDPVPTEDESAAPATSSEQSEQSEQSAAPQALTALQDQIEQLTSQQNQDKARIRRLSTELSQAQQAYEEQVWLNYLALAGVALALLMALLLLVRLRTAKQLASSTDTSATVTIMQTAPALEEGATAPKKSEKLLQAQRQAEKAAQKQAEKAAKKARGGKTLRLFGLNIPLGKRAQATEPSLEQADTLPMDDSHAATAPLGEPAFAASRKPSMSAAAGTAAGAALDSSLPALESEQAELAAEQTQSNPITSGYDSISAQDILNVQEQAEFYASIGEYDEAVGLLQAQIDGAPQASPLPYLKLLEFFYQLSRTEAFEQTRQHLEAVFNVHVPQPDQYLHQGQNLEQSYTQALGSIEAQWPTEQVHTLLRNLLHYPSQAQAERFSLTAFNDLVVLYQVAQDVPASKRGSLLGRKNTTDINHAALLVAQEKAEAEAEAEAEAAAAQALAAQQAEEAEEAQDSQPGEQPLSLDSALPDLPPLHPEQGQSTQAPPPLNLDDPLEPGFTLELLPPATSDSGTATDAAAPSVASPLPPLTLEEPLDAATPAPAPAPEQAPSSPIPEPATTPSALGDLLDINLSELGSTGAATGTQPASSPQELASDTQEAAPISLDDFDNLESIGLPTSTAPAGSDHASTPALSTPSALAAAPSDAGADLDTGSVSTSANTPSGESADFDLNLGLDLGLDLAPPDTPIPAATPSPESSAGNLLDSFDFESLGLDLDEVDEPPQSTTPSSPQQEPPPPPTNS